MEFIIKSLREKKDFSQEELAKELGISRQTYIKYENRTADMPLEIVRQLSKIFEIGYDAIIDNKMPTEPTYKIEKDLYVHENTPDYKSSIKINIPQNNIEKFKQVFLYILVKVGAKPNIGQTVLYKLLYFIDFDYYQIYKKQLMGLSYIKNTYGPTPVDFAKIINQMKQQGQLEEIKTEFYKHEMTKYLPVVEPNLELLNAQELDFINKELEKYSSKTANDLTSYIQKDILWIMTKDNEIIDYDTVFSRHGESKVKR